MSRSWGCLFVGHQWIDDKDIGGYRCNVCGAHTEKRVY
jgi:hypothetical protein